MATCEIRGTIQGLDGAPVAESQVRAVVQLTDQDQSGQFVSGIGATSEPIVVFTDDLGEFSLPVLQGAVIEIEIPAINLRKLVTVPLDPGPIDLASLI